MTLLPALAFGFALGVRHATDADHIAAIGTFLSSKRSTGGAAAVGAMWGLGHSLSVLLVGGALVLLRLPMPPTVGLVLEFLVALMLIALGVRSLRAGRRHEAPSRVRPLLVGVVHGLAGSAVLALMVLGTTTGPWAAAVYLICFGLGTIGGMMLVTVLLTLPVRLSSARAMTMERLVRVTAGVASVVVGVLLAHRVGVQDGLFAVSVFGP
ncbi:MAG: hypothetical protein WD801_10065 [Gemmatimonadaceae bacterium]